MDYKGVNAKVRAMSGKLLKNDDYMALMNANSVHEVWLMLKELPSYKNITLSSEPTINSIERNLLFALAEDYRKLNKFINDYKIKRFLQAVGLKIEIYIIKQLLCVIFHKRDTADFGNMQNKQLLIDVEKLKSSQSVNEFIENLKGTIFYNSLYDIYREDTGLFELESYLDLFYYVNVWKLKDRYLNKTDKAVVERVIGTEVDLLNIIWIYGLKKYYSLPNNLIYTHLMPVKYRLDAKTINRLVETESDEQLLLEIYSTPYGKSFLKSAEPEHVHYKEMTKTYHAAKAFSRESLSVILEYLYLKEFEIKNVITLLECVRYGFDKKEIPKHLLAWRWH